METYELYDNATKGENVIYLTAPALTIAHMRLNIIETPAKLKKELAYLNALHGNGKVTFTQRKTAKFELDKNGLARPDYPLYDYCFQKVA